MLKKTNKKGFTLIELIIVVAIMAVLVALLAPNVMKYLEKSKVGKDINSLDGVRLTVEAEITDEQLYTLSTDVKDTADKIEGVLLKDLDPTSTAYANLAAGLKTLGTRLFGANKGIEPILVTNEAFSSKAANGADIKVYLNGEGAVAVAAVNASGKLISYDGKDFLVSTKFTSTDIAKLDCK